MQTGHALPCINLHRSVVRSVSLSVSRVFTAACLTVSLISSMVATTAALSGAFRREVLSSSHLPSTARWHTATVAAPSWPLSYVQSVVGHVQQAAAHLSWASLIMAWKSEGCLSAGTPNSPVTGGLCWLSSEGHPFHVAYPDVHGAVPVHEGAVMSHASLLQHRDALPISHPAPCLDVPIMLGMASVD